MPIDIILLLVLIAGFWLGYTRGIVATLFSVLEYVIAILLTLGLSPFLARFLTTSINMDRMVALMLSTIVVFFVFILLIKWMTKKIEASFKKGKLSGSTKILGGIVMMLSCIFLYSILLWLANYYGWINEKMKLASFTYKTLEVIPNVSRTLVLDLKPIFQRYWELIQDSVGEPKTPATG